MRVDFNNRDNLCVCVCALVWQRSVIPTEAALQGSLEIKDTHRYSTLR